MDLQTLTVRLKALLHIHKTELWKAIKAVGKIPEKGINNPITRKAQERKENVAGSELTLVAHL